MFGETPSTVKPSQPTITALWIAGIVLLAVLCCLRYGWLNQPGQQSVTGLLEQARAMLLAGKVSEAESTVHAALKISPEDSAAWLLLASIAERQKQLPAAIEAYERVTDPKSLVKARLAAGRLCLREPGRLAAAERQFQMAFNFDRTNMEACDGLAQVLAIGGQSRELVTLLIAMIRQRSFSNFHLYLLSCGGESTVDPQLIGTTDDARSHAARGWLFLKRGDPTAAREELRYALDAEPAWEWAQLALGRALLESESSSAVIAEWHRSLSPTIDAHPEYWQLAGDWARRRGDLAAAARCDWETIRRDPTSLTACFQLGRYLRNSGDDSHAVAFLTRAEELQKYKAIIETARNGDDLSSLQQTVELAERLGLIWEAYGWSDLTARRDSTHEWARSVRDRLVTRLAKLPDERTVRECNPAFEIDLSMLPLPQFQSDTANGPPKKLSSDDLRSHITFQEEASAVGLNFQYINGGDPIRNGLQRMFEFTGGGVAVLDFDRDEWPDAYFVQGCLWDDHSTQTGDLDRLFRNDGAGRFADVTPQVGIVEGKFGQGATTGDIDQDGFPDIFVANIGGNRLFRNQGDGTFAEDMAFRELSGTAWSISAAIADLNADGIPDIYVVNYLGGNDVFNRVCENQRRDRKQTCRPTSFPAADDQLLLGQGDGSFVDVTATSGILQSEGRGMGVMAAAFDDRSRLGLFVANDGTANFHFTPIYPSPSVTSLNSHRLVAQPLFEDQARVAGTAFDGRGNAQAGMGVAAGDINGDTLLDLFVTNFEDETNTLYLQQSGGIFQDRTREYGLSIPSLKMLGFGTQCFDADLDGWLDLIVANGHVNDTGDVGSSYRMSPQFFRNSAGQRFAELTAAQLGPYFAGKYLGRAVANWDWNRDGLTDAIMTHLDAPTALLTNTTPTFGRWLSVLLVGTSSERDAIGTRIDIRHEGRILRRQLTTGDGYMAGNERRLTFGLGATKLDRVALHVIWPSGRIESLPEVPLDHHVIIIEGTGCALPLLTSAVQPMTNDQ